MIFLTKQQKDRYKIMSRCTCERYCMQKHSRSSIIISIKSSWDKEPPLVYSNKDNRVVAILSLSFDDIDMEDDPKFAMNDEDGKRIAEFVKEYYEQVELIIVHCDGGISRSAGIAAGIMRVYEHGDYPVFRNKGKHPNMTCYLKTLKGFGYI